MKTKFKALTALEELGQPKLKLERNILFSIKINTDGTKSLTIFDFENSITIELDAAQQKTIANAMTAS